MTVCHEAHHAELRSPAAMLTKTTWSSILTEREILIGSPLNREQLSFHNVLTMIALLHLDVWNVTTQAGGKERPSGLRWQKPALPWEPVRFQESPIPKTSSLPMTRSHRRRFQTEGRECWSSSLTTCLIPAGLQAPRTWALPPKLRSDKRSTSS